MELSLENFNQLKRIYNTLGMVYTNGENTKVMAKCLEAFEDLIIKLENKEE